MGKYDGASRYTNKCTDKEEQYCNNIVFKNMSTKEAYLKAYPEAVRFNPVTIDNHLKRLNEKDKIIKRIEELKIIKSNDSNEVQKADELLLSVQKSPKSYLLREFIDFVIDCKLNDDRGNRIKGLEAIAKMYNLFNENSTVTNNQLNNIIINAKDVNGAINAIHKLVNKQ